MKFEVVEPADWDGTADAGENAGETPEDGPAAAPEQAEPQEPQARLRASTVRLRDQVRQDAAGLGDSVARLMSRVSDMEARLADSGHVSAGRPPANFRADRFGTAGR
ncbi:hypothetical protein [Marinitenerispora sediminis]|uniref:hypothetical protein n=1 Tax=Marinitenerispora sediminis TaxID=1931232 RepID=UPI0011C04609|nr:hypothetical protein [Marinitenerispora sediminis]